ncbi:hypothetical protein, conserved [Entamoeba dispar SAW760]|uniref:DNA-directed DNA polymerase n=1 Tax=Entamoeba dispar (strain ATCC PRA-260 / SAW760) TaxID=370354 RepID=B0EUM8_ENTDS|nr:uncharacterized protein EDI_066120 [Entamoeba dispar SAW760]EDR21767.1 hypothetical protein, conserved [Entamoeba dispar SAW760]|eukprot:EDR21767.1 hypothetical protein, conserved [Entamoeba dispar SAW760]
MFQILEKRREAQRRRRRNKRQQENRERVERVNYLSDHTDNPNFNTDEIVNINPTSRVSVGNNSTCDNTSPSIFVPSVDANKTFVTIGERVHRQNELKRNEKTLEEIEKQTIRRFNNRKERRDIYNLARERAIKERSRKTLHSNRESIGDRNDTLYEEDGIDASYVDEVLEELNRNDEDFVNNILEEEGNNFTYTEEEIQNIDRIKMSNTSDIISDLRPNLFGEINNRERWRRMLLETFRIIKLIKENDLVPLVEIYAGNAQRHFIINLDNTTITSFINRCLSFSYGIEEFWENYNRQDEEVRIPPGKIVSRIVITALLPPLRELIEGGFFNFYLSDKYIIFKELLKLYQIYVKNEIRIEENCFVKTLIESRKLSEDEIRRIRSQLIGETVSKKTVKAIAEQYKLKVVLKKIKREVMSYGTREINIFLFRWGKGNHYIINNNIKVTSYFIKHYEEINEYSYQNNIELLSLMNVIKKQNNKYVHSLNDFIPAFKAITLLIDKNILIPISKEDIVKKMLFESDKFPLHVNAMSVSEFREIREKEITENIAFTLLFADFECMIINEEHIPFCVVVSDEAGIMHEFYGINCGDEFIKFLERISNPCCYFHNLGYDGRFLAKYGIVKIIKRENIIYSMIVKTHRGKTLIFKDTLALIPTSISNFKNFFKLDGEYEKEVFPYMYYNHNTFNIGVVENCWIKEVPPWNDSKISHFKTNLIKTKCLYSDGRFNSKLYCLYYCRQDVEILRKGFLKYREMIKTHFNCDCVYYNSISSLAFNYFRTKCLSNCDIFEYTGIIRDFISQAVIGGRNMLGENKKRIIENEIVDFDACSLYPSAIHRLRLPTGYPFLMTKPINWYWERLMSEDQVTPNEEKFISFFIVKITVTNVGKHRKMPIIFNKIKGTNNYINDGAEMVVDSIYLEDLIKYQSIEYEVQEGIYWCGHKIDTFSKEIEKVYSFRATMKRDKNPAEIVFKLIMNSCYGKTIQKPTLTEYKFYRSKKDMMRFWSRNYKSVIYAEQINGSDIWMVQTKAQMDSFYTPNIIGVLILSMSKRIMNELIYLCEDNDIDVFYQDTDSIHILKEKLPLLEYLFKEKYGRELVGTKMGQFHSDFPTVKGKESWAIKSIFLGKKCYLDVLSNIDDDIDYLIRMKGIPKDIIKKRAEESFGGNVIDLYEYLYYGGILSFDLSEGGPHFVFERDFTVKTLSSFKRTIKF